MASLPSPASSPNLTPSDSTAQPSRKRQRSRSMQSDTSSSSAKRSISEGVPLESVRSPSSDQMSSLTLADSIQDIDAYMAEQGEADIPTTLSFELATQQVTSASEKWDLVTKGKQKTMEAGETWYLVSRSWWKRWGRACGGIVDKEAPIAETQIGPVDNSSLLDRSGKLSPGLVEGVDVEYVPEEDWNNLVSWYGPAIHPLPRRVITRGRFVKSTVLELHPPQIKVLRLSAEAPENTIPGLPLLTVEVSMADTAEELCKIIADVVKDEDHASHTPYRVWSPNNMPEDWRNIEFPTASFQEADAKIVEASASTLEDLNIESGDAFIVEFKGEDGWLVDGNATRKPVLAIEPAPIFKSNDGFFNRLSTSSGTTTAATTTATAFKSSNAFSGFGTKSTPSTYLSNGKSYTRTLEPGTLGLGNMGNTCFMNSALQCLAHTKELTEYFLKGVFKSELNRDNPLGMQGAIAEVFGALLDRVWATSGASTSYSPREFKQTLQRFAPQFSGYQQHDSQELVAFLLDGLHEDLNRVLKKPYVEKPDWEGGGDEELVKLAAKSWEGYMLRNDSVIVDLFQGQYQSRLVCPECQKVSFTFDPFMYLTLPLPVQKKWKHTIYYIPWDLDKPHVKVPVEINRDSSFKDLRNLVGKWMDAVPENLLMLEIFQHKFYKLLDDFLAVGEMGDNDTVVCFELPCNARMSRTYKPKDDDPFIIPLFLCDAKSGRSSFAPRSYASLFGYPTIVVIDREQATQVDAIYDAVVSRLQRWTANARDLYDWEEVSVDSIDEVTIPIAGIPPMESVTEIRPDGDTVTVEQVLDEEDIADGKDMVVDEEHPVSMTPRPVRSKKDVFNLKIFTNQKDYGTTIVGYAKREEWETWEQRLEESVNEPELLREADAFYAEFDENMKAYFFGEGRSFEHALWDTWGEFVHPELAESRKQNAEKKNKGLTLDDCLQEFLKEEQLGEDDLWYCPQCKKHQQATKKFDLWKAPDILVVHLKRFSNNRLLRDKIDTFVDFPIEGLDLSDKIGERAVAKRLREEGVEMEELKSVNLDEPLVYDLFGVDEHIGGLGGGHYRAYASNHMNGNWYHFDDAYVNTAKAEESVTSAAYLLFYRRRSSKPLGGETYQQAMQKSTDEEDAEPGSSENAPGQPLTPTSEPGNDAPSNGPSDRSPLNFSSARDLADNWNGLGSSTSSIPSPPADDPPGFEDSRSDPLVVALDEDYEHYPSSIRFSEYQKPSPTSSNEAETEEDPYFWGGLNDRSGTPGWQGDSTFASPSYSESEDTNPFETEEEQEDVQKVEVTVVDQVADDDVGKGEGGKKEGGQDKVKDKDA